MSPRTDHPDKFEWLRQQAKALIGNIPDPPVDTSADIFELIHDLKVHQTELEVQNDELQAAQQEITNLQHTYENLYEFAPCGYLTLNRKGIITKANLMAVKMLDTSRTQLLHSGFTAFIASGWEFVYFEARKKLIETGEMQRLELPLKIKSGPPLWVQLDIQANQEVPKKQSQWRMVIVDISEQKTIKESYKQKAFEMESLYEATKLLLLEQPIETTVRKIFDKCHTLTEATSGFLELLNWDDSEKNHLLIKTGCFNSAQNSQLPDSLKELRDKVYSSGTPLFINTVSDNGWMNYISKEHTKHTNVFFVPLIDAGKPIGLIGFANKATDFNDNDLRSITALAELIKIALKQDNTRKALHEVEKQAKQLQKMEAISTLAGGIAHDFNNILGVIIGNTSLLLEKYDYDTDLKESLEAIGEGANKGKCLSQQILTFARGGSPVKKVIQLNELIQRTVQFALSGSTCAYELNLLDDLLPVEADGSQLDQALSNIFINATQAMPDGGKIIVSTNNCIFQHRKYSTLPSGTYVEIKITDQGAGIPEKHLLKIFDPFFSTKQKGTGLGLATTFSIINRHNGQILARSRKNKGTTFTVYLPATQKPIQPVITSEDIHHKGHGTILVMDDQKDILEMIDKMLEHLGYETILTMDGQEAIDKYNEALKNRKPFDLVILDLTVPGGIGGLKTMTELKKIDPDVKAVVSSGYSNDPVMANYTDYGFCDVIPKPYSKQQLAQVLNNNITEKKGLKA